jgi:microcompartment protein CcmK/EutM
MFIGTVIGTVVAPRQHPAYDGRTLLLVKPLGLDGAPRNSAPAVVAVDRAQAGVGDRVLVMEEGSSARSILGDESAPIISLVVAVVDGTDIVSPSGTSRA